MIFWGRQLEYDIYIEKRKVEIVAYYSDTWDTMLPITLMIA